MRTIIAGSRSITDQDLVNNCISFCRWEITQVVSGGARGVDECGEVWAWHNDVPVVRFLPDWVQFGKGAGFKRNTEMARNADALIAIWDGKSRGTEHMIGLARQLELKILLHRTNNPVAQAELAL